MVGSGEKRKELLDNIEIYTRCVIVVASIEIFAQHTKLRNVPDESAVNMHLEYLICLQQFEQELSPVLVA